MKENQRTDYIRSYPCGCFDTGVCWILSHPKLEVPISFRTEQEARKELKEISGEVEVEL